MVALPVVTLKTTPAFRASLVHSSAQNYLEYFFSDAVCTVFTVLNTLGVWDKYRINSVSFCVETCRFWNLLAPGVSGMRGKKSDWVHVIHMSGSTLVNIFSKAR